nr:hypothetical protein [Maliibacterium massiliense]
MIRRGLYALYKRHEYKATRQQDGRYKLVTRYVRRLTPEFVPSQSVKGVFVCVVEAAQITRLFFIQTTALYRGFELEALRETARQVLVRTQDGRVARALGMQRGEEGYFYMLVPKEGLSLIEHKRPVQDI